VRNVLTREIKRLPEELRQSLTWDQGKEMAGHVQFAIDTNVKVFFCDPHSPWQRGSSENTDLSVFSRADLAAVSRELNDRPRQSLEWMKPSEVFGRAVASTA
jgi:IS30 family transposase